MPKTVSTNYVKNKEFVNFDGTDEQVQDVETEVDYSLIEIVEKQIDDAKYSIEYHKKKWFEAKYLLNLYEDNLSNLKRVEELKK